MNSHKLPFSPCIYMGSTSPHHSKRHPFSVTLIASSPKTLGPASAAFQFQQTRNAQASPCEKIWSCSSCSLAPHRKRKSKPANQASNKPPNQMDSLPRLHNINVQQSSNSIYPSTLISLIPPFSTLSSSSHTSLSISLSLSPPHVQLSASQADRMLDPTWEKGGGGRSGGL